MQRAGRIVVGVLGGLVFVGAAGGTFWWLQSRTGSAEVPLRVTPGLGQSAPSGQAPAGGASGAPSGQAPTGQTPTGSAPGPAGQAPPSQAAPASGWAPVPLPAGTVKIERGSGSVTMTEPGFVRFDVQTGESAVWHWSRSLVKYGATPVGDWAAANGDPGSDGLLVQLSTGNAYRFKGELLWLGAEGALFEVTEGERKRLILTDAAMKPQTERWLPDRFGSSYGWQREESGWFRFWVRGGGR